MNEKNFNVEKALARLGLTSLEEIDESYEDKIFEESFRNECCRLSLEIHRKLIAQIQEMCNDELEFSFDIRYSEDGFNSDEFEIGDELYFTYDNSESSSYIYTYCAINKRNGAEFPCCLIEDDIPNDFILQLWKYNIVEITTACVYCIDPAIIRLECKVKKPRELNIDRIQQLKEEINISFLAADLLCTRYYHDKESFVHVLPVDEEIDSPQDCFGRPYFNEIPNRVAFRYYWSSKMKRFNGYMNILRADVTYEEIDEALRLALDMDQLVHSLSVDELIKNCDDKEYYMQATKYFDVITKIEAKKKGKGQVNIKTYLCLR